MVVVVAAAAAARPAAAAAVFVSKGLLDASHLPPIAYSCSLFIEKYPWENKVFDSQWTPSNVKDVSILQQRWFSPAVCTISFVAVGCSLKLPIFPPYSYL